MLNLEWVSVVRTCICNIVECFGSVVDDLYMTE